MSASIASSHARPNDATRQLARCLQPLIEQLPAKYRDALVAVDLDGRAHHEVAAELGMSTSGMKSRVQRGRRQLGDLLSACCRVEVDAAGGIRSYRRAATDAACGCRN